MPEHLGPSPEPRRVASPAGTTLVAVDGSDPAAVLAVATAHVGRTRAPGGTADPLVVLVLGGAAPALAAAAELRRSVGGTPRIAVHTGPVRERDGVVRGPAVARVLRLLETAAPGRCVVSARTASAAGGDLPDGTVLADLGVQRLRDLAPAERVHELLDTGERGGGPLRAVLDDRAASLPVRPTSFVGRTTELAELRALVDEGGLLTVVGPGGSGKSRIAAELAAEQAGRRTHGAVWAELAAAGDAEEVAATVATAAGVLVDPALGAAPTLPAQLADRRLLLCLDTCEHVLDAVAGLVDELRRTCPDVQVLATSREPLGLAGETVWTLPAMAPDDAHELLLERATQADPGFAVDDASAAAMPAVCRRLDGSPLALELAAAWLRTLTPQQIEAGLDDRFALLVRSPRDAVPRHASLLASVAWSHDLLDPSTQVVFRRLAVLGGGFDLDAAAAVCADDRIARSDVVRAVGRLVDTSLVRRADGDHRRHELAETIRAYADDRLRAAGERTATADRHLAHRLAQVRALASVRDHDKDRWRTTLAREHDNLRAAIEHGLDRDDPGPARRLAAELPWLWHLHRQGREGLAVLHRAIARDPDDRSAVQARLLAGVALVADTADPLDVEEDAAGRAMALAVELRDERLQALCLMLTAVARLYTDLDGATATARSAEDLAARTDESFVADAGRALRGIVLGLRDRHEEARALLEPAAAGLAGRGDRGVASTALAFLSGGAVAVGDGARGVALAERAIATAEPLADHLRLGIARAALALALGAAGDLDRGIATLRPLLPLVDAGEHAPFVPEVQRALGTLRLWAGDADDAVRRLRVEAATTDGGRPTFLAIRTLPALATALRRSGDRDAALETARRATELARERGMPGVLADACEERARQLAEDDPDAARELLHEALAVRTDHGLRGAVPGTFEALAALGTTPVEHALRLLGAADAARAALGRPRPPVDRADHDALLARMRVEAGDAAGEAERGGAALTLDEAVAWARRARGSRTRPLAGWGSLTPAELEVVRLAVEGLSNPQIGERLYMSRSTVKTHLSHVYAKLGIGGRTELAAVAATHPS